MINPYGMVCNGKNKRLEKKEFKFEPIKEVVEPVVEKPKTEPARKGFDASKMAKLKAKIKGISDKMEMELNKSK